MPTGRSASPGGAERQIWITQQSSVTSQSCAPTLSAAPAASIPAWRDHWRDQGDRWLRLVQPHAATVILPQPDCLATDRASPCDNRRYFLNDPHCARSVRGTDQDISLNQSFTGQCHARGDNSAPSACAALTSERLVQRNDRGQCHARSLHNGDR